MKRCEKCRRWIYSLPGGQEHHRRPPVWECSAYDDRDDEDERVKVYADDPKDAAKSFARLWWDDEYPSDGDTLDVAVFAVGEPKRFTVTVSWSVDYSAREQPRGGDRG